MRQEWILLCLLLAGCGSPSATGPAANAPAAGQASGAGPISILAWNVESGGSAPAVIASQLAGLSGHDVYCLSEVHPETFAHNSSALGAGFESINSATGGDDRLQIIFDGSRFALLQQRELHRHGDLELNNGKHRSPLFVRLRDRNSGVELIVMANHLARRDADLRSRQAAGLREWARDQNTAVVSIGDFNMDYDFPSQQGNEALAEMLRDGVWKWVRPAEFIDTNWSDPDGNGRDNYPDSMLDFTFVAGPAKDWRPECRVIVRDGDFPDDKSTSDHRPIELRLRPRK